nr:hypothetical protein [Tanacetum cinerariifolium]
REPPLRVQALVMTIGLDLPKKILNAQTEARKPENNKKEDVGGKDYAQNVKNQSKTDISNTRLEVHSKSRINGHFSQRIKQ